MSGVVFLDLETTGLDPDRHEIWDIGLIREDGHEWNPLVRPVHPEDADPNALRMNGYYDVFREFGPREDRKSDLGSRADVAAILARSLAGKHIVGAVPSFDAAFLERFLRANGEAPAWHYHLVDVEAMAAGWLGIAPPWDSEELSRRVGVDPSQFVRHSAIGDARWARAVYLQVLADRDGET